MIAWTSDVRVLSMPPCPPWEQLEALGAGRLDDDTVVALGEHISTCPSCQAKVGGASRDSTDVLLVALRAAAQAADQAAYVCEPACRVVVARVGGLIFSPPAAGGMPATKGRGRLGRYALEGLLGEGGMGVVFRAVHTELDRTVAIKFLRPAIMNVPGAVQRFKNERRAVAKVHHPNIVAALDAGESDGTHYLVMEYVDGIDLGRVARQHGPLDVPDACELVRQAAVGLEHAHRRNIVHRDVKPSNLMLTRGEDGQCLVKVLDLGLARLYGLDHELPQPLELTAAGQVMGTAEYMAPEQAANSHNVDIRADVYSLGATLLKLLTGQTPRQWYDNAAHDNAHTVPVKANARGSLPDALVLLLNRLLASDPDLRPASPGEVARQLQPLAAGNRLDRLLQATVVDASQTWTRDRQAETTFPTFGDRAESRFHAGRQDVAPSPSRSDAKRSWPRRWVAAVALVAVLGLSEASGLTNLWRMASHLLLETAEQPDGPTTSAASTAPHDNSQPSTGHPGKTSPESTVSSSKGPDYDRIAAEWVMSMGEPYLDLMVAGRIAYIRDGDRLPDKPFKITLVNLNRHPKVTDEGFAAMNGIRDLMSLQLTNVPVTDAVLPHLADCKNLEILFLYSTRISDAGLPHLEGFSKLKRLSVKYTLVTESGVRKLAKAIPGCEIEWSGGIIKPE